MNQKNLLIQVNKIFCDILDIDNLVLKEETTANDVEDWDSLSHIQLIVEIEKHFKIKFKASEIQNLKNVGGMCEIILKKINE